MINMLKQRVSGLATRAFAAISTPTPALEQVPGPVPAPGFLDDARTLHRVNEIIEERDEVAANRPQENAAARWASSGGAATAMVVIVTLGYLALETRWALAFLDAFATATTTPEQVRDIEFTGRWLSAFGLMWMWGKTRFLRTDDGLGHYAVDAIIAGVAVFALVGGIGIAYERGINSLSKETSMQVFELGASRTWALRGELPDALQAQLAPATKEAVSMAVWPLLVFDAGTREKLQAHYARQRTTGPAEAVDKLLKAYPDLQKTKQAAGDVTAKHREFLSQSAALVKATNSASQDGERWYFSQENVRDRAAQLAGLTQAFADTWGSAPNPAATLEQFVAGTVHSKYADVQKIGAALAGQGTTPESFMLVDLPGLRITGADVVGLSQPEYEMFIKNKFNSLVKDTLPTRETVKSSPLAHDVIASVVVPPVAMLLSCLSVLANSASIIGALAGRCLPGLKALAWVLPASAIALAYVMVPPMALPGLSIAQKSFTAAHPLAGDIAARVATVDAYLLRNL